MTLTELEQQYPGLFEQPGCEGPAQAEVHADRVASKVGLTERAGSWAGGNGNRHIEYRNRQGTLKLTVEIFADPSGRGSTTPWLFSFSAERVDACLTAKSPHAVRVKPSSFEREAAELVARLRSLAVENGRVSGRLKKWNAEKGMGVLECFPGALVSVQSEDLPRGLRIGHNELLSFAVEKSAMGQKAVNVRRCSGH